jgi:hypothetical protein
MRWETLQGPRLQSAERGRSACPGGSIYSVQYVSKPRTGRTRNPGRCALAGRPLRPGPLSGPQEHGRNDPGCLEGRVKVGAPFRLGERGWGPDGGPERPM